MMSTMMLLRTTRNNEFAMAFCTCYKKYCTVGNEYTTKKNLVHPYRRIHPWKSENEFVNDLLKNVIYNAGKLSFFVWSRLKIIFLSIYNKICK